MTDPLKSLAGKYFINSLQAQVSGGAIALLRGRVLGLVHDFAPFYLCEIYPAADDQIAITTETVVQIDQLTGVYFYDSRALLDAAWDNVQRSIKLQLAAIRREQAKERRKRHKALAEASE